MKEAYYDVLWAVYLLINYIHYTPPVRFIAALKGDG
jgi:hypothetical protein